MNRKEQEIALCYAEAEDCNYFTFDEREEYERWLDTFAADAMAPKVIADQNIDFPESDADLPL